VYYSKGQTKLKRQQGEEIKIKLKRKTLTPKADAWIQRNPKKAVAGATATPLLGMTAIDQYRKRKKNK
jgi:hypothetical protein